MADFSTLGLGQRWLGGTVSNSRGVTVTPNATADTKGSFAQLISAANNTVQATGVLVTIGGTQASGEYLVDIAVGSAGNEVVVIPNLYVRTVFNGKIIYPFFFPIAIPSGTRVSARAQGSQASTAAAQVTLNLVGQGFLPSAALQRVTVYGLNTTVPYLTGMDPGASANTKSGWTQITSSTANDCRFLVISIGGAGATATQNIQWLFDIGIGGAGSEVVLISNLGVQQTFETGNDYFFSPTTYLLPVAIPAGTRLSMRCQCSVTTASERVLVFATYGID